MGTVYIYSRWSFLGDCAGYACEAHSVRVCLVFLVGGLWRKGVWNLIFALFYFINIIIGFFFPDMDRSEYMTSSKRKAYVITSSHH